ncbi:FAD/NAD(P)-binding domain-containing protein [Agrocybe pediades]|nr:FAD/NAD(P)-binding domain-containing protein [Agrocybe pediades]
MEPVKKLRIAIVGGGIGGLALAVTLKKLGVEEKITLNVYESAAKLTQVGAGVTMWPRAWEIMKNLGMEEQLIAKLPPGQEQPTMDKQRFYFSIRKSNQKEGLPIVDVVGPGGAASFHRADIQSILLHHASPTLQYHLSHRLTKYLESKDGLILEFSNGVTAVCDLLIGADGLNSAVRKTLLAEGRDWTDEEIDLNSRPIWTGIQCYRCLVDADLVRRESPESKCLNTLTNFCGKNRTLVVYPISQGRQINIAALVLNSEKKGTYVDGPVVQQSKREEVIENYQGWEEDVEVLLKHVPDPSRWSIQYVKPLESYRSQSGKALLLGDAAHATTPDFANGAGLAIEDAYMLGHITAKVLEKNLAHDESATKISKVYDEVRRPFCNAAAADSRTLGEMHNFTAPDFEHYVDGVEMPANKVSELGALIQGRWNWVSTSVMPDLERALGMI